LYLTQHQAQGTSLAVLTLPVVILGTIKYYVEGNVSLYMAVFIALGFIAGAYLGATFAHYLSNPVLKKVFGVLLLLISLKMIFWE
jgi:Sulfite exporter TauE/SafE.